VRYDIYIYVVRQKRVSFPVDAYFFFLVFPPLLSCFNNVFYKAVRMQVRIPSFLCVRLYYIRRKIAEETNAQYNSHMHQSAVVANILALRLRF
jgi:hypothetical protein